MFLLLAISLYVVDGVNKLFRSFRGLFGLLLSDEEQDELYVYTLQLVNLIFVGSCLGGRGYISFVLFGGLSPLFWLFDLHFESGLVGGMGGVFVRVFGRF